MAPAANTILAPFTAAARAVSSAPSTAFTLTPKRCLDRFRRLIALAPSCAR